MRQHSTAPQTSCRIHLPPGRLFTNRYSPLYIITFSYVNTFMFIDIANTYLLTDNYRFQLERLVFNSDVYDLRRNELVLRLQFTNFSTTRSICLFPLRKNNLFNLPLTLAFFALHITTYARLAGTALQRRIFWDINIILKLYIRI